MADKKLDEVSMNSLISALSAECDRRKYYGSLSTDNGYNYATPDVVKDYSDSLRDTSVIEGDTLTAA